MTASATANNLVVLDGFTLNPGDLSWDGLRGLGACTVYERTPLSQLIERAAEAQVVITNKTPLQREHIKALKKLRYIGVTATGYNIVDVDAASARGIVVTNVPGYGTASVAQHTFALILELTQHVGDHARTVSEGRWVKSPDWCYWDHPLTELEGLTLGIIGYGRIGQAVGRIAQAFGLRVITVASGSNRKPPANAALVDLEFLFQQSDIVTLHCPLTPQTRHLVNAEHIGRMKPSAFLINTSRGPLIDEAALASALNAGRLAGAGLDVLSLEPPAHDNPLLKAKNCLITPHIAWATRAARARLMGTAVANVSAFLAGTPQNVVNMPKRK